MSHPTDHTLRALGAIVGLAVGSLFSAAAIVAEALGVPIGPTVVFPILASGAVGGWLLGPGAVAHHDRRGWVGLVVGFGFLAVLIGDGLVVVGLAVTSLASPDGAAAAPDVARTLAGLTAGILELTVIGLIAFGWLALPFTLMASALWTAVMRALSTRLGMAG